jgi:hypothetical protein
VAGVHQMKQSLWLCTLNRTARVAGIYYVEQSTMAECTRRSSACVHVAGVHRM